MTSVWPSWLCYELSAWHLSQSSIESHPSLSRSTVYGTLSAFVKAGLLAWLISIES